MLRGPADGPQELMIAACGDRPILPQDESGRHTMTAWISTAGHPSRFRWTHQLPWGRGCGKISWQQGRGLAPQVPVPLPGQKGTGTSLRSEPVPICPPGNLAAPDSLRRGCRSRSLYLQLG